MVFRQKEVEKFIGNLKKKKACGDDRVPNECMKYVSDEWKEFGGTLTREWGVTESQGV